MDCVSIVIPTYNRLNCVVRAVESALAQRDLGDLEIEIIVVDNSPDANAREAVGAFAPWSSAVRYLNEPKPGVANARNAGVKAARGRWVAFLDDDEEAPPRWIAHLIAAARRGGVDAVFGPVEARAEGGRSIAGFEAYFSRRIDRADGADVTDLAAYLGTNNSLFDRRRCLADSQPFDPALNELGGEDSLLIKRLAMSGRRFAFARQASVVEWVPPARLTWAYVCKRKFLSGQIRIFTLHMVRPVQWDRIAIWMAVGLTQFIVAGIAALVLRPLHRERAAKALATAYGGLGKVLWLQRFRPALYGVGLVS